LKRAIAGARTEKKPLYVIEEELIGVSHAEVGAYLLSLWGLPYPVVEAVAHHHHPERVEPEHLDLVSIVYYSNLLAHEYEDQNGDQPLVHSEVDLKSMEKAGLADRLDAWRQRVSEVLNSGTPQPQGT